MKRYFLPILVSCSLSLFGEVYDCFTFFNELELLKVRFEELYDVVDHFVLVESPISFTGKEKPLYFAENRELFTKYDDKIIHLILYDFPANIGDAGIDHWMREEYSRNFILQGLKGCKGDDIILISDLDEIPSRSCVLEIKDYLENLNKIKYFQKRKIPYHQFVCTLDMRLFMYQLNFENTLRWQHGAKAVPYWFLEIYTPWEIKLFHHTYTDMHLIKNAGWHLNTMGGKERALYKWLLTGPLYNTEKHLEYLKTNDSLLEKTYQSHVASNTILVPINDDYPQYILQNLDYFHSLGWFENE